MDSKLWNELRKMTEKEILDSGAPGVRLVGGIMDGWLVRPDADALRTDWYKTNPSGMSTGPGRYVLAASGTEAEWMEDGST